VGPWGSLRTWKLWQVGVGGKAVGNPRQGMSGAAAKTGAKIIGCNLLTTSKLDDSSLE
jgi:hypothetical protein